MPIPFAGLTARFIIFFLMVPIAAFPSGNERVLFLHHSTGAGVYNEGHVASWFDEYNQNHGTTYSIAERSYPASPYPWANYPYDYWNLWINGTCSSDQSGIECMSSLVNKYDVVIFKHCFPGADIEADTGSPDITSSRKSLENYKLQYRALRQMMDSYPRTIFILWTLAPLHRLATTAAKAARAAEFVRWVKKDYLTEDGKPHPNIFIFDFWGNVAEPTPSSQGEANCLRYEYEESHSASDSHPNSLANQTIGPVFAQGIVDAIEDHRPPCLIGVQQLLLLSN